MIQVCIRVFICSITGLTEEARLPWATTSWVLNDHGLAQVLVQLQRPLALLHEFCGLWQILLRSPLAGLLA